MPQFSIITAFRNRDAQRVKNSLDSLAKQTIQDFELIFVDYGSDEPVSETIKPIVKTYSFAKYVFNNTRGGFWSRSHALNTGIKLASGQFTILWDIDLMVDIYFLEQLRKQINYQLEFSTHRCYYLPKEANTQNYKTEQILNKSHHAYVGLCTVDTSLLQKIRGFDEFYQVWGAEDDDLYARLQAAGFKRKQIDATKIPVYHQWHPSQAPALPDMWYLKMVEHLFADKDKNHSDWGKIYTLHDRPALQSFMKNTYKKYKGISLNLANKTLIYNNLIKEFINLKAGKKMVIDFKYPQMSLNNKAQKIIKIFNDFMQKRSFNFRLMNQKQNEREILKQNIYSFLKYFMGVNRSKLKDYFLNWREDGFLLILIKKE